MPFRKHTPESLRPAQKQCFTCKETKPASAFPIDRRNRDGLTGICRPCAASAAKASRELRAALPKPLKTEKTCTRCHVTKTISEFYKNRLKRDSYSCYCRECHCLQSKAYLERKRQSSPDGLKKHLRRAQLRCMFGITPEDYDAMIASQKNLCAICGQPETAKCNGVIKALSVDHCHSTGKVRELLCNRCNVGIGRLGDSIELLEAAAAYLRRHASG
jgi:hypothetical protein